MEKQIDENAYISAKHAFNPDQSTKLLDQAETVPANSYFVLPDNERDFGGSKAWGFVEKNRLTGVVSYKVVANSIKRSCPTQASHFRIQKWHLTTTVLRLYTRAISKNQLRYSTKSLSLDPDYQVAKISVLLTAIMLLASTKHRKRL